MRRSLQANAAAARGPMSLVGAHGRLRRASQNVGKPTKYGLGVNLTEDPVAFKKTKHILRAANELRERVARCIFAPAHVASAEQYADILTKPLRPGSHALLLDRLLTEQKDYRDKNASSSESHIDSTKEGVLVSSQEGVSRGVHTLKA